MTKIADFNQAHRVLFEYASQKNHKTTYTLDRMTQLMDFLGNPERLLKIIHVAGTSGKTSTCYFIAALLQASGKNVGLTVSPHVDEVNERIQLNLEPLNEVEFCNQLEEFVGLVQSSKLRPSYFELLVAFAYWYFAKQKVDYAVVEVGLGGTLDATNVVMQQNKVCVITDIGYDHVNVLGKTLTEIAQNKTGIIYPHNAVLMYQQGHEVMNVVNSTISKQQSTLKLVQKASSMFDKDVPWFQHRNWQLAHEVYEFVRDRDGLINLDEQTLQLTKNTHIPGRMDTAILDDKIVIVDGSHNGQKMEALVNSVQRRYPKKSINLLVSFVDGSHERPKGALQQLSKITNHITVTSFNGSQDTPKKSVATKDIAGIAAALGLKTTVIKDPKQAFKTLLKQKPDVVLVTGSFYLMNHIRPLILNKLSISKVSK